MAEKLEIFCICHLKVNTFFTIFLIIAIELT